MVLNKADLCADPGNTLRSLGPVALGVDVHVLSALREEGLEALAAYLVPGRTLALVGSSGVGKSTLLNRLAGADLQTVRAIRERDARGQHTTTARRLLRLPSGALCVDTPGMREVGLWDQDEGLEEAFADVAALARDCRFGDSGHGTEPGCAVQDAIAAGALDPERLHARRKLEREIAFLRREQERRAALERRRAQRAGRGRRPYNR